jgi:hypothetical protein
MQSHLCPLYQKFVDPGLDTSPPPSFSLCSQSFFFLNKKKKYFLLSFWIIHKIVGNLSLNKPDKHLMWNLKHALKRLSLTIYLLKKRRWWGTPAITANSHWFRYIIPFCFLPFLFCISYFLFDHNKEVFCLSLNRKRLFSLINDLPTVFEVVTGRKPTKDKPSVDGGSKSKNSTKVKCYLFHLSEG